MQLDVCYDWSLQTNVNYILLYQYPNYLYNEYLNYSKESKYTWMMKTVTVSYFHFFSKLYGVLGRLTLYTGKQLCLLPWRSYFGVLLWLLVDLKIEEKTQLIWSLYNKTQHDKKWYVQLFLLVCHHQWLINNQKHFNKSSQRNRDPFRALIVFSCSYWQN